MASQKAAQAKDKGNKLFKDGHLAESVNFYKEAEKLDPKSPVYTSNLSAALYELGDYAGCLEAILRSWSLKPSADLSAKLSTRLAKTLSQGVQDGSISPSVVEQNFPAITELEKFALGDNADSMQTWKTWKNIRKEIEFHSDLSHEAKIRFSKLPIFKGMPHPILTYFAFGTDPIVSLVDGWGPDNVDPIKLQPLTKEQISRLSFMIAGVGDGRHALGTVLGLGKAHETLKGPQKEDMKVHLTILDVHFASIARNLLYFLLVDQLLAKDLKPGTRLEIKATLVYLFIGWVMPSYCHTKLLNLCKEVEARLTEQPPRLPSWIHIDKNSIKPVLRALEFWQTDRNITAAVVLDSIKYVTGAEHIKKLMDSNHPGVRESMQGHRTDAERALRTLPADVLVKFAAGLGWPKGSAAEYRQMLKQKKKKEEVIDIMVMAQFDKSIGLGLTLEGLWYKRVQAFVPPEELLHHHPGFELFYDTAASTTESDAKRRKVRSSVLTNWKPNITILDGTLPGCLTMDLDAFLTIQEIGQFCEKLGIEVPPCTRAGSDFWTGFSYAAAFFDGIVDTVKNMQGNLQLEFICNEMNSELFKIQSGTDSRPTEFPKKFTRIWLSNIPDYTHGTLSTAIFTLPALQDDIDCAATTSNCMFNSPTWTSDDEFCYNYTMLLPRDLERYLGIKTLNGKAVHDVLTLSPSHLPRPLNALASRENLYAWLTRLLLSFVSPGTAQVRPHTIKLPLNLVAFVKLLAELRHIGYPSHWLSDFLNSVLNGTLQADHMAYKDELPRPVAERQKKVTLHRVRLDPWYAEFETILASARQGLPFAVQLPEGFATTIDEIGLFRAEVSPNMLFSSMMALPKNENVIALLFYKSQADLQARNVDHFLSDLPSIVDGRPNPAPGSFHVFTTQEFVDLSKSEVRWKMPKALAAKMKREKWSMSLIRTDFHCSTTEPCPATRWQNVEAPI